MLTAIQTQEKWALTAISNFYTGSQKFSIKSIFELEMRGPDVEVRNRSKQLFRITHGRRMSGAKFLAHTDKGPFGLSVLEPLAVNAQGRYPTRRTTADAAGCSTLTYLQSK